MHDWAVRPSWNRILIEEMDMMKLKDLMSRDVQVIDANATIMEVAEQMRKAASA